MPPIVGVTDRRRGTRLVLGRQLLVVVAVFVANPVVFCLICLVLGIRCSGRLFQFYSPSILTGGIAGSFVELTIASVIGGTFNSCSWAL